MVKKRTDSEPDGMQAHAPNGARARASRRMPKGESRDRLLDVHEAAALLGLEPSTLYQWAYKRRIPVVKLFGPRGALRFRLSDLEKLIQDSIRPATRPLRPQD